MDCTEAYKEHIMYSFNGFCKVVIRYAAINAWRDRNRRRQKEISFEYLTEEKFYPLSTSDEFLKSPYEQYPITICSQTIILTNGELCRCLSHQAGSSRLCRVGGRIVVLRPRPVLRIRSYGGRLPRKYPRWKRKSPTHLHQCDGRL